MQHRINNRSKTQYKIPIFISNGPDKITGNKTWITSMKSKLVMGTW